MSRIIRLNNAHLLWGEEGSHLPPWEDGSHLPPWEGACQCGLSINDTLGHVGEKLNAGITYGYNAVAVSVGDANYQFRLVHFSSETP